VTEEQVRLVLDHLPMARKIAGGMARKLKVRWLGREDLEQLGAIGLMAAARVWDGGGSFGGFAGRYVRGAILDEFRRATHRGKAWSLANAELLSGDLDRGDAAWSVAPETDQVGVRLDVRAAVAALPEHLRRVIVGVWFEGEAQKSTVPGLTEGAVSHRRRRALGLLARRLKGYGNGKGTEGAE